jgi:hypothetical protein
VEQDDPVTDVPIIDVLRTNAEGLPGAYGPFVDNDAVRLEIWLTDAARPVDVRITACPWEDVATIAGIPDPLCANRTYHAASSPLRIDWQLPGPGPYGIRVEATNEGVITSTSRLRAVRNGTSSRIMELMPVAGSQGETLIRTILSPSADNSHEGNLTFTLVAKTHDAVLLEKRTTFAFALPTAERSVDRAIVGLTPVEIPAGTLFYELHAQVAHGSDVLDEYTRIVDSCAPYGLCCAPGMTVDSLRTLPYAPPR